MCDGQIGVRRTRAKTAFDAPQIMCACQIADV